MNGTNITELNDQSIGQIF